MVDSRSVRAIHMCDHYITHKSDSVCTSVRAPAITRRGTRRGDILLQLTVDVARDTARAPGGVAVNEPVCLDVNEDLGRGLKSA